MSPQLEEGLLQMSRKDLEVGDNPGLPRWALNLMTSVLLRGRPGSHTEKEAGDHEVKRGAMQPQKPGKAANKLSSGASEGAEPADITSQASEQREYIASFSAVTFVVICYSSPRKSPQCSSYRQNPEVQSRQALVILGACGG